MNDRPMTPANLAVERVLEHAADHHDRPGRHTLLLGGTAEERHKVLDRIETRLRSRSPGTPPHIGRVRRPFSNSTSDASALWDEAAAAAGVGQADHMHTSGLGRIQNAGSERLVVVIVDDLDAVLAAWSDPGEALNLRWALQNVNGLMVVAGAAGSIGQDRPHEHAILAMTFASQSLQAPANIR